jgi:beta-glucosidase/6-phospho-beta-glucosidase/beta-galactosidase
MPHANPARHMATTARHFIFCTGIENSYPVIRTPQGRQMRRDGMALSRHYDRWREDFRLVKDLGINFLRYGPPYYKTHLGPMRYDWSFADKSFGALRQMGIHPITDLCHFGVPDWIGNFQNPEWPLLFADYARAFAKHFPWVRFYTPVNEIFVAARFSAALGWWNEQLASDHAFVTALKHLARANILAEEAILEVQPEALFIQSESSEYFHCASPGAQQRAHFFNQKRFLSLDLCYGCDVSGVMYEYLADNGVSREEYHWFLDHGAAMRPRCIMGNDYYITNEHEVFDDGHIEPSGEIFGYYVITKQYFDRYRLPVMHTETNRKSEKDAPPWLWKEWSNVLRLKDDGVPILGFTWYSLLDQTDWDTALREDNHRINPMGLYDLHRKIRPVGQAYKKLIRQWRDQLPLESMSRDMFLNKQDVTEAKRAAAAEANPATEPQRSRHPDVEQEPTSHRGKAMRHNADRDNPASNDAQRSRAGRRRSRARRRASSRARES